VIIKFLRFNLLLSVNKKRKREKGKGKKEKGKGAREQIVLTL
jgi:hypothetical protein